ncbi:MAG: protein kinase [Alphaproteobacteria bacterium]|nr:protein kinase [Alphaproteobacteria bacterium]
MDHPPLHALLAPDDAVRTHLDHCAECARLARIAAGPAPEPRPRERYERRGEVHRGGMGRTVAAWDRVLEREVLLKEMATPSGLSPSVLRERFEREARVTARLAHPSILTVYDLGEGPDGQPFYAMPFVEGRTLTEAIGTMSREEGVGVVTTVAEALAYAHEHGVVHRDVKPDNVLVGRFGEVVLIDWGLASEAGSAWLAPTGRPPPRDGLTELGVGTASYMAPEQARGQPADPLQDVYALGATLYHVLAGEPPWAGRSSDSVRDELPHLPPTPLSERAPGAAPELVSLVERSMARDPAARLESAAAFAAELRRYREGLALRSHRYSLAERLARFARRWRVPLTLLGAAVVGLVVASVPALVQLAEARRRTLDALERALTSESALRADDPHDTALALRSAVEAVAVAAEAGRAPTLATRAALDRALSAPTARTVPGATGWGPRTQAGGRWLLADPARGLVHLDDPDGEPLPLHIGFPMAVAGHPSGRWIVVDDQGRAELDDGTVIDVPVDGAELGWADAETLVFGSPVELAVTGVDGTVIRRVPLEVGLTRIAGGDDHLLYGDQAGALWRFDAESGGAEPVLPPRGAALAELGVMSGGFGITWSDGLWRHLPYPEVPVQRRTVGIADARACVWEDGRAEACIPVPDNPVGMGMVDDALAFVQGFGKMVLWDTRRRLEGHPGEIVALAAVGDAVISVGRDGSARIGHPATGASRTLGTLEHGVAAASVDTDGIWVGAYDGTVGRITPRGLDVRTTLPDAVSALVEGEGGAAWAATYRGDVVALDADGTTIRETRVDGGVVGLLRAGDHLVVLGATGVVTALDDALRPTTMLAGEGTSHGWGVSASGGRVWLRGRDDTVLWDPASGEVVTSITGRLVGLVEGGPVTALPDGTVVVSDASGGRRRTWFAGGPPPRGVSATGRILGEDGAVWTAEGELLTRSGAAWTEEIEVTGWRVAGDVDGGLHPSPLALDEALALACSRLVTVRMATTACPSTPGTDRSTSAPDRPGRP